MLQIRTLQNHLWLLFFLITKTTKETPEIAHDMITGFHKYPSGWKYKMYILLATQGSENPEQKIHVKGKPMWLYL